MTSQTSDTEGGYAHRILSSLAREQRDSPVVRWRERDITAGELHDAICGQARALHRAGLRAGDVAAVLAAPDSPLTLVARYAAHLIGAAVCYVGAVNPAGSRDGLRSSAQEDILRGTRARVLVCDEAHTERAKPLADSVPGGVVVGPDAVTAEDEGPLTAEETARFRGGAPDELAMIMYTSGSSGSPKGIRLSYRAWESCVAASAASVWPGEQTRFLIVTSLAHTVGPMADGVLGAGGYLVLHPSFDAAEALAAVERHRITRTYLAVAHLYGLLDCPQAGVTDLSSLRQVMYGGSPAAPARLAEAVRVLGMTLVQGYGTSEGGRVSYLHPGEHRNPKLLSTAGRLFPEVSLRICDPETHEEVEAGQTGEVCTRSPQMMDGYWDDPERTARVLSDGWYRTGDIGYLDDEGYLHLLDRLGDVIKADGVKIYPATVERVIAEVPGVAQVAVYGVADPDRIEHVAAAVVPHRGDSVDLDAVRARVRQALTDVYVPETIRTLEALPLNAAGKPDKKRLRSGHEVVGT